MSNDTITNAIYDVFTPLVGRDNINIREQTEPIYVVITRPAPLCYFLELYISTTENNNILVYKLDNCHEKTMGAKLLSSVEILAKRIGSNQIKLIDASKLEIAGSSVSLKTLYNLTTGQSWYNKLGYICKDEDYDTALKENNTKITTTTMREFSEEIEREIYHPIDGLLEDIKEEFSEFDLDIDKTIQDYFTIVKNILQQYSSGNNSGNSSSINRVKNKNIRLLIDLVNFADDANIITTHIVKDCILIKDMKTSGGKTASSRIRKRHNTILKKTKKIQPLLRKKSSLNKLKRSKTRNRNRNRNKNKK